jgi:hypothetical protein
MIRCSPINVICLSGNIVHEKGVISVEIAPFVYYYLHKQ